MLVGNDGDTTGDSCGGRALTVTGGLVGSGDGIGAGLMLGAVVVEGRTLSGGAGGCWVVGNDGTENPVKA
jgi:hypothetical protein